MPSKLVIAPDITMTGSAVKVVAGPYPVVTSIFLHADPTNANPIYVGDSTVTVGKGLKLFADGEKTVSGDNEHTGGSAQVAVDLLYVIGSASDVLHVSYLQKV